MSCREHPEEDRQAYCCERPAYLGETIRPKRQTSRWKYKYSKKHDCGTKSEEQNREFAMDNWRRAEG